MAFNGSGSFSLASGNPVVTGTTISSTWANNTLTDIATGLSTTVCKDGQQTITANLPMAGFRHTGVGNATTRAAATYASAADVQDGTLVSLTSISGTNTVTATAAITMTAYASGQSFRFIPANTNTGATTINLNSIGAKNIFWLGAACVGGEIRQNIPVTLHYDGTQFNIVGNGFNAPFLDTHPIVEGSADSTKKVRFEVDGLTTATTRVITAPDRDLTLGNLSSITNSTGADVALNNTANYFDGPVVVQGTSGTWFASGTVTVVDTAGAADIFAKLWDGTTVIDSSRVAIPAAGSVMTIALSGVITSPAGNLRISCKDISSTSGAIKFNSTTNSTDSTITAIRVG